MAKKDDDLLMLIGVGVEEPVLDAYARTMLDGPLAALKHRPQHGAKQGESVFTHVVNGVYLLSRLAPLVGLTDDETRVLFAAYTVHDLNKLPLADGQEVPFNALTSQDNVAAALTDLGAEGFFPDWRDYLPDVWHLVRAHSGHYSSAGESLVKSFDPYRLGRDRLERLVPLMRAVDTVDLSHSLEERRYKATFLKRLNEATETQYEFVTHKVSESRGLLTNLIHNAVVDHLAAKGLTPLLYYPDGVAYLKDTGRQVSMDESDMRGVGERVAEALAGKTRSGFADFIKSGAQGIKVDEKCLALGVPFREIFREVHNLVSRAVYTKGTASKPARYETMNESIRRRLVELSRKLAAPEGKKLCNADPLLATAEKELETGGFTLPPDDEALRLGELIRTYYIYLQKHFPKAELDSWERVYGLLNVPAEHRQRYAVFDALYDRAYVVGKDLRVAGVLTFEEAYARICADGATLVDLPGSTSDQFAALSGYVAGQVSFSGIGASERDFAASLRRYVASRHVQCSVCGSEFDTGPWMAADVPANVKVQYFSNRLEGGTSREPKRNVCEVCRAQFLLEKLSYNVIRKSKTYFAHLYPYSFFTADYLNAFRQQLGDWRGAGVSSALLKVDEVHKDFRESGQLSLRFAPTKVNGNPVPRFSEVIGNVITEPVNAPGDNDTERFLFALENALILKLFVGCRAVLSDSDIPPLSAGEAVDFLIDSAPPAFRGLLPASSLTWQQSHELWDLMVLLHQVKPLVFEPKGGDPLVALVRALDGDPLELFAVTHRQVDRKSRGEQEQLRFGLLRKLCPLVSEIVTRKGGEAILGYIRDLATIAWEAKLKGDSLKDTALAKPLDVAFDVLERWDSDKETEEEIQALLRKEIGESIERVTEAKYWGQTKIQRIAEFVDVFWNKVFKEVHKGRLNDLLERRRRIRSTFIQLVADQIGKRKETD